MKTANKPARIATLNSVAYLPAFFVTVYALMQEGHYTCISHAPYSTQPKFDTEAAALAFIRSNGVADCDIARSTFDPRPMPAGC